MDTLPLPLSAMASPGSSPPAVVTRKEGHIYGMFEAYIVQGFHHHLVDFGLAEVKRVPAEGKFQVFPDGHGIVQGITLKQKTYFYPDFIQRKFINGEHIFTQDPDFSTVGPDKPYDTFN